MSKVNAIQARKNRELADRHHLGHGSGIQARLEKIEGLLTELKATATKPMDLDEGAAYLHISKSHLYQLTSKALIAHFKPNGKKIYLLKQDLDAYLLRNRRAAAEEIET